MREVIGQVLPFAVGAALSPFPIIAMVLMLVTSRARANSLSFLVGWVVGLAAIGVVVLTVASGVDASSSDASDGVNWTKFGLGVLLVVVAARQWRKRPTGDEQPPMPKWMGSVEEFTPLKACGAGVVLSAVNPKNLLLSVGAATVIAQSGLPSGDQAAAYAVFALIATIGVAIPLVIYFSMGDRAPAKLSALKDWMALHNSVIMAVICLIIGVKLIGDAIGGF